jgi:hypothetical protein
MVLAVERKRGSCWLKSRNDLKTHRDTNGPHESIAVETTKPANVRTVISPVGNEEENE